MVKVAHFLCTNTGGASIAALRLHSGLLLMGVSSRAYVGYLQSDTPVPVDEVFVLPAPQYYTDGQGGLMHPQFLESRKAEQEALAAYPNRPAGLEAFSTSSGRVHLADIPELHDVDIFHFHWIAGFINIPGNAEFLQNKKVVWSLHDMQPFTGGCHYTGGCQKFKQSCGACPQLGSSTTYDLSRATWQLRHKTYPTLSLHIVCPSRWLAEEAAKSSLVGAFPIHHIPYGLPLDMFKPYPQAAREELRKTLGLKPSSFAIIFSAENILNERKGLHYLLDALRLLHAEGRNQPDVRLILLGNGEIPDVGFPVIHMGRVHVPSTLAALYCAADVLLLPTLEDNLPNVVLEALAVGTPVVAFNVGGVPDMVEHKVTGFLADARNISEKGGLVEGIRWAMETFSPQKPEETQKGRLACRSVALERYGLGQQADAYLNLYNSI